MKKEQFFLISMLFFKFLPAQTEADTTIVLPVVELQGSKASQSAGMIITKIDSSAKIISQFNSVAELLSEHSSINIRNYGNGLLSTINARGTGANHTAILWNGTPLNSPNLGLTDLSLLPVFLFDKVAVISGNTGTIYGNNSMGTAIELVNNVTGNNEIKISSLTGSYGSIASNIKLTYSNKNFNSATSFYKFQSKNNFEFRNIARFEKPFQKQINASQQQMGLMQLLSYNFTNTSTFRIGLWYQFSEREIPPLMFATINEEIQRDGSFRFFGEWKKSFNKIIFTNNISYFREFIFYNNYISNIQGASDVKTFRDEINLKFYSHKKIDVHSSFSGEIAVADILEYQQLRKVKKLGLSANVKYILSESWRIGGGLKKEFTDFIDSPLAVSAGAEGTLIKKVLESSFTISRIYSLPTLNDLYWKPGGNENLKPENGVSSQLNLIYYYYKESRISITGFYSLVNDWIQWIPNSTGLFSPVNIKKVESYGLEASIKHNFQVINWKFSFSGNYSFTKAINKSFENNAELVNKQLTFAPQHSAKAFIIITYKETGIYSNIEYTGERYFTADNSALLEPYLIINSGLIINYKYDRFHFLIKPEIKNLFDVEYQPIPWRAMPGRSYFLTLNMNLNLNKLK